MMHPHIKIPNKRHKFTWRLNKIKYSWASSRIRWLNGK